MIISSFLLHACKDELSGFPSKEKIRLLTRGGGDDPSTTDLLELVGTACVPGSILNVGQGCNDQEYTDTSSVTLAAYTGCTFTVVYHYYTCVAGSMMTDYTMGDFQLLSHNCSAFNSALSSALTTGGSTLTNFVESFELSIYNQLEQQIIAQYVTIGGPYHCLTGAFFNILFLKSSCYKRCFYSIGNGAQSYAKVACGSDCCERHTFVCRDEHNALVIETEYVHPVEPYCENPPTFDNNPILTRCDRETSCQYKCLEE